MTQKDLELVEAAVTRERAFLRTVIDSVSSLIMVRDGEGRCLLANEAAARFHGTTVQTLEGAMTGELATLPREALLLDQEVLRTGTETVTEMESVGVDGVHHSLLIIRTPLRDEQGVNGRVLVTGVDMTWRKRTEKKLRESEEKFGKAFATNPAAIAITHADDGHIVEVNETWQEMFGYTRDEVVGQTTANIELWPTAADREQVIAELGGKRSLRNREQVVVTRSGQSFVTLMSAETLTVTGEPMVLWTWLDITERKRAEEALRRANAELAEADHRKDEFIAILSHELRNPLAPIRYAMPILQAQKLDNPGHRAVIVINRQMEHLARLVDDLLDVSRITRDKIDLRREHVTIGSVLTAAVEAASPAVAAARHTLKLHVPDEPIWVHADPARISQVVTNLLNNSAKYTPRGGEIVVEAGLEGGRAFIRVTDNGMGIPVEALPGVFEMFRQVNRPDKSQGGLGIGLALSKRLVEMHDGSIEVQSEGAGKGSQFTVRLPVAAEVIRTVTGKPEESLSTSHRLRVLVVDDNADLVEMLALAVEGAGHEVRKALDGRSAISAALSYKPNVILLDIGLPVMSGLEVARELRNHAELSNTRLVALTGWGTAEDRRQTEEAGFDHHLTKPTDPHTLQRLLARFAHEQAPRTG